MVIEILTNRVFLVAVSVIVWAVYSNLANPNDAHYDEN